MIATPLESRVAHLELVCDRYEKWWQHYVFTNEINDGTWFDFGLKVKTAVQSSASSPEAGEAKKEIIQPVLEALEQYANQKILISGSPGAGKSTLMAQILLKFARRAQKDSTAPTPVLVELKSYRSRDGIWGLIQTSLEEYDLYLEVPEIKKLVAEKQLVLLMDGLNELLEESARTELESLCRRSILLIVTTRDLGRDLSIERKLEIQPLNSGEVETFLLERLPNHDRARVKEVCDRVQDFGQTPLMVWMLYSVFSQKDEIPETRGEAYRAFTTLYAEQAKKGIDLDESRFLLSKLAFEMMQSEKPTDFRLEITEIEAENLLTAKKVCEHLLDNHLLQREGKPGNRRIRFCHQSLQEYYAAEALLMMFQEQHPDVIDNERFQHFYLNYLKWTESIAILLGFPEISEDQGRRFVELALDVDLMLGARLVGKVGREIQHYVIESTEQKLASIAPEKPVWLKLRLMETIGSKAVITHLIPLLDHPNRHIRNNAHITLLGLAPEEIPEKCRIREDSRKIQQLLDAPEISETQVIPELHPQIMESLAPNIRFIFDAWISKALSSAEAIAKLIPMLRNSNSQVRWSAVQVIGSIKSEASLSPLLQAIEDPEFSVSQCAAVMLGKIGFKSAIPKLTQIINQHPNSSVRYSAVQALRIIGSEEIIPGILQAMQDSDVFVCREAVETSEKLDSEETVPGLLAVISHSDAHTRRLAAYNLRILSVKENIAELLNEKHLQTLVQALNHSDEWIRWRIAFTLWNVASEQVIPLLRPKLNHQDCSVSWSAALVLGKFGCKEAVPELIQMMDHSNLTECPDVHEISYTAAYALGQVEGDVAAKHLPKLINLLPTQSGQDVLRAIAAIQNRCQFYNHKIFQTPPKPKAVIDRASYDPISSDLEQIKRSIKEMSETPKQDFSRATFNAPVNFGDNNKGDIIGTQNNYASDSKTIEAYAVISRFLQDLRQKHPQASEQELLEILTKGFESMPTRNPQRWQQWKDVFSLAFAGGAEALKTWQPLTVGIPIEVAKRLYEIYNRNRKQLPSH